MDYPGKHASDHSVRDSTGSSGGSGSSEFNPYYVDGRAPDAPTSGAQQFWWLADTLPLGRLLVIGVLAAGLVGIGFVAGRVGQRVVVQQVNVPILAPREAPLPTASVPQSRGVVLDASLDNPSGAGFDSPSYAEFQPRLPWEEAPSYVDPALLAIDSVNREVSFRNVRSMENYVRRMRSAPQHQQRPASETYYVTRRTPAYSRQAQLGDRPARYLLPGTPLRLVSTEAQWAQVMGPGGETLWVKAKLLSSGRTYRSS